MSGSNILSGILIGNKQLYCSYIINCLSFVLRNLTNHIDQLSEEIKQAQLQVGEKIRHLRQVQEKYQGFEVDFSNLILSLRDCN